MLRASVRLAGRLCMMHSQCVRCAQTVHMPVLEDLSQGRLDTKLIGQAEPTYRQSRQSLSQRTSSQVAALTTEETA